MLVKTCANGSVLALGACIHLHQPGKQNAFEPGQILTCLSLKTKQKDPEHEVLSD
jgi:hypothetical protein